MGVDAGRRVVQRERHVVDGRGYAGAVGQRQALHGFLVFDAPGQRLLELRGPVGRERLDEMGAVDLAVAEHADAVADVAGAVGAHRRQHQRAAGRRHRIGADEQLDLARVLGRGLHLQADGVAALEQVGVAQAGVRAQAGGVGRVGVVQLGAAMQRQLVLHLQVDLGGSRELARPQQRRHAFVGRRVDGRELLLHLLEVGHAALGEARHELENALLRVVARADDAHARDRALDDVQAHDAGLHLLGRDVDRDGAEAAVAIRLLERGPRRLDGVDVEALAHERIDRALDGLGVEHGVAFDLVLHDVEALHGRRVLREDGAGREQAGHAGDEAPWQQAATSRRRWEETDHSDVEVARRARGTASRIAAHRPHPDEWKTTQHA